MKGRLDAAFMRPEPHAGGLVYRRVRTEPLIVVFPSDHRLAARKAIKLREIKGEPFIKPSKTAPTLRKIIEDSLKRPAWTFVPITKCTILPTPSR